MVNINDFIKYNQNKKIMFGKIVQIDDNNLKWEQFITKDDLKIKKKDKYYFSNNELFLKENYAYINKIDVIETITLEYVESTSNNFSNSQFICRFKSINEDTDIIRYNEIINVDTEYINLNKRNNHKLLENQDIDNIINMQTQLLGNTKNKKKKNKIKKIVEEEKLVKNDTEANSLIENYLKKFEKYYSNNKTDSGIQRYNIKLKLMEIFLKTYTDLKESDDSEFIEHHSQSQKLFEFISNKAIFLEGDLSAMAKKENINFKDYIKKCRTLILSLKHPKNVNLRNKIYYGKINHKDLYYHDEEKLNEEILDLKILKCKSEYMTSRQIQENDKMISKNHKGDIEILYENENNNLEIIDYEFDNIKKEEKETEKLNNFNKKLMENQNKYKAVNLLEEYINLATGNLKQNLMNIKI